MSPRPSTGSTSVCIAGLVASAMAANRMLVQCHSDAPISLAYLMWSASVLSRASPEPRPVGTSKPRAQAGSSLEPVSSSGTRHPGCQSGSCLHDGRVEIDVNSVGSLTRPMARTRKNGKPSWPATRRQGSTISSPGTSSHQAAGRQSRHGACNGSGAGSTDPARTCSRTSRCSATPSARMRGKRCCHPPISNGGR